MHALLTLIILDQGKSGTGAVAILRSKPEQTNQRKDIHSGPVGKYHYHHPRTRAYGGKLTNHETRAVTFLLQARMSENCAKLKHLTSS